MTHLCSIDTCGILIISLSHGINSVNFFITSRHNVYLYIHIYVYIYVHKYNSRVHMHIRYVHIML